MFSFASNDGDEVDRAVGDADCVKVGAAVSDGATDGATDGLPMISRTVVCHVNT